MFWLWEANNVKKFVIHHRSAICISCKTRKKIPVKAVYCCSARITRAVKLSQNCENYERRCRVEMVTRSYFAMYVDFGINLEWHRKIDLVISDELLHVWPYYSGIPRRSRKWTLRVQSRKWSEQKLTECDVRTYIAVTRQYRGIRFSF